MCCELDVCPQISFWFTNIFVMCSNIFSFKVYEWSKGSKLSTGFFFFKIYYVRLLLAVIEILLPDFAGQTSRRYWSTLMGAWKSMLSGVLSNWIMRIGPKHWASWVGPILFRSLNEHTRLKCSRIKRSVHWKTIKQKKHAFKLCFIRAKQSSKCLPSCFVFFS